MGIKAFDKFDLTGRTAVVTAGATGMGYYMARGLARSGARVLIAQRREEVLKKSAERLRAESGGDVIYATVDLNDRASVRAFNEHAQKTLGGVDIFVGNAAQDTFEKLEVIKDETIDKLFQINVSSIIEMTRAFVPSMRQKKWGRLIFSSSSTSLAASAHEGMGVYTATKGALNSFAHTVAAEVSHDGVTCNTIVLGLYVTDLFQEHIDFIEKNHGKAAVKAFTDSFSSMVAAGRLGRADEVEGLLQFLASNAGSYVTGSNLVIDGGMATMLRPKTPPEDPIYPPLF